LNDVVDILNTVTSIIKTVSKDNLPVIEYKSHLKPYWTPELTRLSKEDKHLMREWKEAGRPRDDNSDIWRRYKDAKHTFQREHRRRKNDFKDGEVEEFDRVGEMDNRVFWYFVNRRKPKKRKKAKPVRDDSGRLIVDEKEAIIEWEGYCKKLFTPQENDKFDEPHKTWIEDLVNRVIPTTLQVSEAYTREYSLQDVSKICKGLKVKKAPGWDKLDPEHWKYGGNNLWLLLTVIVNAINRLECIPIHMKRGVIVPIEKPEKDSTYKDNNRCITLGPVVCKIWEKLLMLRFVPWVKHKGIIDELQGCSHQECSSLHTNWLLRETVSYNVERGSDVYMIYWTSKQFLVVFG
jgi:hypothetical protein